VEPAAQFQSNVKRADLSRLKGLGFVANVPLREGVRRVVDWQAANGF
jgi:nucleoside-diphosphate-sugar epimerase